MTYEEHKALSIKHAADPKPGDYWHERFSPVALVLEVTAFHVTYLSKTRQGTSLVMPISWTWDASHVKVKTRAEFRDWLSYESIPGTWALVVPEWKHFAEFRDAAREIAEQALVIGDKGDL